MQYCITGQSFMQCNAKFNIIWIVLIQFFSLFFILFINMNLIIMIIQFSLSVYASNRPFSVDFSWNPQQECQVQWICVWYTYSNICFQFLNKITHIFIYFFHSHVFLNMFSNNKTHVFKHMFLNTYTKHPLRICLVVLFKQQFSLLQSHEHWKWNPCTYMVFNN